MARRKDYDEEYEEEYEDEDDDEERVKKPHYFLRGLLAFILGIIFTLAVIAGVGYYVVTRPLKKGFGLFGIDYGDFLTENGANMTILEIVTQLGSFNSFGAFAEITPLLDEVVDTLEAQMAEVGMHLDKATFKATPFDQIGSYFADDVVPGTVLGETLSLKEGSNKLMLAVCYGEEGVDFTFDSSGNVVMIDGHAPLTLGTMSSGQATDIFGNVYLETFFDVKPTTNATIRYLAYGEEGVNYKIENGEIVMLAHPVTGEVFEKKRFSSLSTETLPIENARIGDLIDTENADNLLKAIKDWRVGDLSNSERIERLSLSQVISIGEDASPLMQSIRNWRIGDLTDKNKVNMLKLGDVLSIDRNSADTPVILKSIADTALGDLETKINSLRLDDIFGADKVAENKILKNLKYSTLKTLADDIQNITVHDVFGDELYSYLEIQNGTTYRDLLAGYDKSTEAGAALRPQAYQFAQGQTVETYYMSGSREVQSGSFVLENGTFKRIGENETVLYQRVTEGEGDSATTRDRAYVERTAALTPVYRWKYVFPETNEEGGSDPYPDSSHFTTEVASYKNGSPENLSGTPFVDNQSQLYFVDGEVCYPLFEDAFSIYYISVNDDGESVRTDLELATVGYELDGTTYDLNDDGTITVGEKNYKIYTQSAGETGAAGYDYIVIEADVTQLYYYSDGATIRTVETQTVSEHWRTHTAAGATVELDRYLGGVWYILFGGEQGEGDSLIVLDKTDSVLMNISNDISAVTGTLNNDLPLWKLYLHEVIDENPFAKLPISATVTRTDAEGNEIKVTVDNLQDFSLVESIQYIKNELK